MYVIQFQFKKNEPGEFFLKSFSFPGFWSSDRALTTAVKETSSLARGTGVWEGLRTRKGLVGVDYDHPSISTERKQQFQSLLHHSSSYQKSVCKDLHSK